LAEAKNAVTFGLKTPRKGSQEPFKGGESDSHGRVQRDSVIRTETLEAQLIISKDEWSIRFLSIL
jgi:hypothetical protein